MSDNVLTLGELAPFELRAPEYSYIAEFVRERDRLLGSTGITATAQSLSKDTGQSVFWARSFDLLARDIRLRRRLLKDPRIPRPYRKTTQVIRAGQAWLSDLLLRIAAILAANPSQVRAVPVDDSPDARRAATAKEEFIHATLLGAENQRALLDTGASSVWRDFYDNLISLGRGCFLVQAREDRWSDAAPGFPRRQDYELPVETRLLVGTSDEEQQTVPRDAQGKTAARRYVDAVRRFKENTFPFVLESVDPTTLHVREDEEAVEDEAIVIAIRPYRQTLERYGLRPTDDSRHGPDILVGSSGTRYEVGSMGLGRPYPRYDWPTQARILNGVETVMYFSSGRRARWLGLVPPEADPDEGVWAMYVDGVCVQRGALWGPPWHPLPVFRAYGLSSGMPDPLYRGIPVPLYLLELADAQDQIMTMRMHIAYWSAFPMLLQRDRGASGATGLPGEVLADPETIGRPQGGSVTESKTLEPGSFRELPPGKEWQWFTMPADATAHLDRFEAGVRQLADLLGVPSVFRGAAASGTSGYAIAQLSIAARATYDPIVDNATACQAQAVRYLWWQVWRRFDEGVAAYVGAAAGGRGANRGWVKLRPEDIAPDWQSKQDRGTPFLQCQVKSDPLLPQDEAQMELRGINATQSRMVDRDTARERYFGDSSPEQTEARIIAQEAVDDPLITQSLVTRQQVRMGILSPKVAPAYLASKLGIPIDLAMEQLRTLDALTPEQEAQVAARTIAAGGQAPGTQPVPGVPGVPVPQQPALPAVAPPVPQGRTILPGVPRGGGQPTTQPSIAERQVAMIGQ